MGTESLTRRREEIAYSILLPHFDAVRDTFTRYEPEAGVPLSRLRRVELLVTVRAYQAPRNFARCRDDGRLVELAPQSTDLDHEQLVGILSHELGHAADFAYPGSWVLVGTEPDERRAEWIGSRDDKAARRVRRLWHERGPDEVEWTADAIALAVTGLSIGYCGRCMIQCFSGPSRPAGLR